MAPRTDEKQYNNIHINSENSSKLKKLVLLQSIKNSTSQKSKLKKSSHANIFILFYN